MIPKIIHYCWFGKGPLPPLAEKCISSWKKYLPDYKINRWDETNYDVHSIQYISEAYNAHKYAFVSDYARFDIIYKYGGLYFDTDVELIAGIDDIIIDGPFLGFEKSSMGVNSGLGFSGEAGEPLLREILDSYLNSSFINDNGSHNLETVVDRVTKILVRKGLQIVDTKQSVGGVTIYPSDYFCPKDIKTGKLTITGNTRSIHHFDGSWIEPWRIEVQKFSYNYFKKHGNTTLSRSVTTLYHVLRVFQEYGLKRGISYLFNHIR